MHVVKAQDLRLEQQHVHGPNLLHSYIVMVVIALIECGLVQILTKLVISGDKDFGGVATTLLNEVLRLSADLMPRAVNAKLHVRSSLLTAPALIPALTSLCATD